MILLDSKNKMYAGIKMHVDVYAWKFYDSTRF
jgi:hypothetical protein